MTKGKPHQSCLKCPERNRQMQTLPQRVHQRRVEEFDVVRGRLGILPAHVTYDARQL